MRRSFLGAIAAFTAIVACHSDHHLSRERAQAALDDWAHGQGGQASVIDIQEIPAENRANVPFTAVNIHYHDQISGTGTAAAAHGQAEFTWYQERGWVLTRVPTNIMFGVVWSPNIEARSAGGVALKAMEPSAPQAEAITEDESWHNQPSTDPEVAPADTMYAPSIMSEDTRAADQLLKTIYTLQMTYKVQNGTMANTVRELKTVGFQDGYVHPESVAWAGDSSIQPGACILVRSTHTGRRLDFQTGAITNC